MSTLWFALNIFFAASLYKAADDEVYEKSRFVWFSFLFLSAWNAASAVVSLQ